MTFGHPSGLTLSRFVDGDLPALRLEKIAAHVEQCGECREHVEFMRTLGTTATELDFAPPPTVADQVVSRRRAGERIDLLEDGEEAGTIPAVPWTARLGIAASVALAALVAGYMFLAPPAGAHRSALSFDPETPTSGETISLTYDPASYLGHHDSLRLRMRARNAESPNPRGGVIGELRVATLRRNADGKFEGRFALEPGDLYVAAAVEDFTGENIDTNFGQLWDVLVAEEDGEPSVAALESKYRVLEPFNWVLAAEWAAEAAERYPGNPFGWTMLYVHQTRLGTVPLSDSLRVVHEKKLRELAELADGFDAEELYWLADYARRQGRSELRAQMLDRLRERAPHHRAITEQQVAKVVAETGDDTAKRLDRLEGLSRANSSSALLVRQGILAAARLGDMGAVDRWIDRALLAPDLTEGSVAALLDPFDEMASRRIRLRSYQLEELRSADGSLRSLRTPTSEHRKHIDTAVESTKMGLAGDLLISGDTVKALSVMADVAEAAWKPEILEPFVDELLTVGDTAAARPIVGMLYADPIAGNRTRAKYASILSSEAQDLAVFEASYWRRVRESAIQGRRLPPELRLRRMGGGELEARDLSGKPTVFLMWDPRLPTATTVRTQFEHLISRQDSEEINWDLVARTQDEGARSAEEWDAVIYDRNHELSQALGNFAVPKYVVLNPQLSVVAYVPDASAALRFARAFVTPVY